MYFNYNVLHKVSNSRVYIKSTDGAIVLCKSAIAKIFSIVFTKLHATNSCFGNSLSFDMRTAIQCNEPIFYFNTVFVALLHYWGKEKDKFEKCLDNRTKLLLDKIDDRKSGKCTL